MKAHRHPSTHRRAMNKDEGQTSQVGKANCRKKTFLRAQWVDRKSESKVQFLICTFFWRGQQAGVSYMLAGMKTGTVRFWGKPSVVDRMNGCLVSQWLEDRDFGRVLGAIHGLLLERVPCHFWSSLRSGMWYVPIAILFPWVALAFWRMFYAIFEFRWIGLGECHSAQTFWSCLGFCDFTFVWKCSASIRLIVLCCIKFRFESCSCMLAQREAFVRCRVYHHLAA